MARLLSSVLFLGLLFITSPSSSLAGEPLDVVKERIDQIIELIQTQGYQDASGEEKINMLLAVTEDLFNKEEISRRVLGIHWRKFTPEQQLTFIDLFAQFLERNYFKNITTYSYENETVQYTDEILSGDKALVKTMVITRDKQIPVDYFLKKDNGQWMVYDARIEGVSLVRNYRSQFSNVLRTKSPEELLDMLRERVDRPEETSLYIFLREPEILCFSGGSQEGFGRHPGLHFGTSPVCG
jgi:phospholipid transport system substrate-binding protein